MPTDSEKVSTLRAWLVANKTATEIQEIAETAALAMMNGKTVTSVSFEGGSTTAFITNDPANVLAACQGALVDLGETEETDATAPTHSRSIFVQFSGQPMRT